MKQNTKRSPGPTTLLGITTLALLHCPASAALVNHWDFEEGVGTTAGDSAGANPGAISGATWASDGVRSSFLSFNGTTDVVDPSLTLAAHTDASIFTWAVWVNNGTEANNNDIIIGNRKDGNNVDYSPRQFNKFTVRQAEWHINGNGNDNIGWADPSPAEIPVGTWTHLAFVKDGSTITAYQDGVETSTKTLTESLASSVAMPFFIGGEPNQAGGEHFAGGIDDVRIYDNALSAGEIALLAGTAVPEPSSFLLAALGLGTMCLRRKR